MPALPPFLQLRASNYGHWFAVVAAAAVAAAMGLRSQGRVEFNTAAGIAQALGRYQRCTARPQDFVWERSQGLVHDLFVGRAVLFLCGEAGKRDLYRGRIRLSPEGRALHVVASHRLTQTPDTDETDLMAVSGRAAVLQRQNQHVVAARIIDWNGKPPTTVSWWRRIVQNWIRYGASTCLLYTSDAADE